MKYTHAGKCGGLVHPITRTCTKCHKKWGLLAFWLDPKGIRMTREPADFMTYTKQEELTTIQSLIKTRIPGGKYAVAVAGLLPRWPRWIRITVTVAILGGLIGLITWLVRR